MSLAVSICYQQRDHQMTMECLVKSTAAASEQLDKALEDAGRRLGPEQKIVLDRATESWRAAISDKCKASTASVR